MKIEVLGTGCPKCMSVEQNVKKALAQLAVQADVEKVTDIQQIKVGEHGLLMKNGEYEGLLLPQVPVEQKWDRQKFLEETCRKAGMSSTCWQDADTDIFRFTAVVFGEHKP